MSQRLALIVGNSLYRDEKLAKLTSPEADVGAFADALLDQEMGGFDDVKLLVNMASHTVRRAISDFFSRKNRTDLLLFYFSGHGVLDDRGRLYFALKDTDTSLLRGTAIPAHYVTDEMDNSRSQRQLLILDCCHSGAFARGSKSAVGASVGTASTFEGTGFGRVVLTASDATQYAWEGNQIIGDAENSLFTHFIVKGIQSGEADANQDGEITVDELYDYAYSCILKETPNQTPGKWSFKEQGDLIISHSPVQHPAEEETQEDIELGEDEDEQLDQLYTDGLSAMLSEEWDAACQKFEEILENEPDFLDTGERLKEAQFQRDTAELYLEALSKYEAGELKECIASFEEVIARSPQYKDAAEKLEKIKAEKILADLVSQVEASFAAGDYDSVVEMFDRIYNLAPDYKDHRGLRDRAQQKIDEAKRLNQMEDLYQLAKADLSAGRLDEAKSHLSQIQQLEGGYRNTEQLLERINQQLTDETSSTLELIKPDESDEQKDEQGVSLFDRLAGLPKWAIGVGALGAIGAGVLLVGLILLIARGFPNRANQVVAPSDQVIETIVLTDTTRVEETQPPTPITELQMGLVNPLDGAVLIAVPAGEFEMGADPQSGLDFCIQTLGQGICGIEDFEDEGPVHTVFLDEFWIYQSEVTNQQYAEFLNENRVVNNQSVDSWIDLTSEFIQIRADGSNWVVIPGFEKYPVVEVTWDGAVAYCQTAGGRLPTEAEWEKAAKGEENLLFPWGNQFESQFANVDDETIFSQETVGCSSSDCDGFRETSPVGTFPSGASPYGVMDMSGNVWEWVSDWYGDDYYENSPSSNPAGPQDGTFKIRRGGS
ncbi:MAG: SUMF1/EgtB/PvdO family nonheme iron enzyme, partial [Gammaproteobacteria bacterium]|nr:SUMF1/EgtB/PvdO family nonheme iron enzyme [Gammaproteobacteria bacterium]